MDMMMIRKMLFCYDDEECRVKTEGIRSKCKHVGRFQVKSIKLKYVFVCSIFCVFAYRTVNY